MVHRQLTNKNGDKKKKISAKTAMRNFKIDKLF